MDSLIYKFLLQYQREYDFYSQVAKICANQIESRLESSWIRAIVTFRAKRLDRLEEKLLKREKIEWKKYRKISDIYKDIVDLAWVRIALYFPWDILEVEKIIQNQFDIIGEKNFPKDSNSIRNWKIFAWYKAKHFRINLKEEKLTQVDKRFSTALIEIQIASVLMHWWAEVEHDLDYKNLNWNLSLDESAILDELNWLVLTWEIALERLQRAFKWRIESKDKEFSNHFELAAYIYDIIRVEKPNLNIENSIWKVDILFKFCEQIKFNKPDKIKKFVQKINTNKEDGAVSEQIIDMILVENPKFYEVLEKVKLQIISKKHYKSKDEELTLGKWYQDVIWVFITKWIQLEALIKKHLKEKKWNANGYRFSPMFLSRELRDYWILNEQDARQIDYLRRFRNNLVHWIEIANETTFLTAIDMIDDLIKKLQK